MEKPFVSASMKIDFVKDVILSKLDTLNDEIIEIVNEEISAVKLVELVSSQVNAKLNWAIENALNEVIKDKVRKSKEINAKIEKIVKDVVIKL